MASQQLSATQLHGLRKAGDILIPGDAEMPSFSQSGVLTHVDRMLDYMNPSDLTGVRFLVTLFAYLPKPLVYLILALAQLDRSLPGPLAAPLRMINIGMKGVVMTLYYSDLGEQRPSVLERIKWDAKIVEPQEGA